MAMAMDQIQRPIREFSSLDEKTEPHAAVRPKTFLRNQGATRPGIEIPVWRPAPHLKLTEPRIVCSRTINVHVKTISEPVFLRPPSWQRARE